jgi:hypothetical protein
LWPSALDELHCEGPDAFDFEMHPSLLNTWENNMRRLPCIAAAALALTAAAAVMGSIATPAAAQGWRDDDRDIGDGELRELLREVLMDRGIERRQERRQERREDLRDALMEHIGDDGGDRRGRLRERVQAFRDRDDEDDGDWRSRLRQRIAERRDGGEGCYFLTRSLRDEDGDLLVIVRRRRCRD